MAEHLRVLIASPEVVPFAKTGGLADVTGALPKALSKLGIEVAVILPKYQMVDAKKYNLMPTGKTVSVPMGNKGQWAQIFTSKLDENIKVYFIDKEEYFNRPYLYGTSQGDYPDNADRFIFFSKAVLEVCRAMDFQPQVIHCNDWQTGLLPVYLKDYYGNDPFFSDAGTVFTIHNMGYQGVFPAEAMSLTNLDPSLFSVDGLEFYGKVNLMKGALLFSDFITTVSKTYSLEIQTPENGYGLDGVLRFRKDNLYGILNGIDYQEWSPEVDNLIPYKYSRADLSGKWRCKQSLLAEYQLPFHEVRPLIGMISRMADQKGFDLVAETIEDILALGVQLIILGSGEEKYHKLFAELGKKYPTQVIVKIAYDNALAHKIEAGADIFLMPSRYEPCGLNQLYSLRYGTIPLVRSTGGLADSIIDYFQEPARGTGFKFYDYSAAEMLEILTKTVKLFGQRDKWKELMVRAMEQDFSWESSARQYLDLYKLAHAKRKRLVEKP